MTHLLDIWGTLNYIISKIPWFILKYWYAIVFGIILQSIGDYLMAKRKLEKELERIAASKNSADARTLKRLTNEKNEIMLDSVYVPLSIQVEVKAIALSKAWLIMTILYTALYLFIGWNWWWGSILWLTLAFGNGAWSYADINYKTGLVDEPEYKGFGFGFLNMPIFPKFIRNRRFKRGGGLNGDLATRIFFDFFMMAVITLYYYFS